MPILPQEEHQCRITPDSEALKAGLLVPPDKDLLEVELQAIVAYLTSVW